MAYGIHVLSGSSNQVGVPRSKPATHSTHFVSRLPSQGYPLADIARDMISRGVVYLSKVPDNIQAPRALSRCGGTTYKYQDGHMHNMHGGNHQINGDVKSTDGYVLSCLVQRLPTHVSSSVE